ncbi:NAD-dependent epimerase/dehydratase family protein [Candidatus Woesearchaeota archaeon]|nr:MAG: NAD-dependent epimerase/dehydratase family protein [Candidatus Woesearchaeota archaeon]
MKILVTGGAGFLGSHICEKYVNEGHTVVCVDNLINGDLSNVRALLHKPNFKFLHGDIRDKEMLEKAIPGCDAIFHLAAQIHVDRSVVEPHYTYETNVLGTLNILELARLHDVKKTIFASSSEVYGSAQTNPMKEDHPLDAPHPYGASKVGADRLCFSYHQTYGMPVYITRCFNMYGPKQKDSSYGGVISIFTRKVMNNMPPIIYGTGEQTRDYLYVKDAVKAYDLVLQSKKNIAGIPINFGTGKDHKIIDIANMIIKKLGKNLKPVHVSPRPGEVEHLIADMTRAKELLGFSPDYDFEKGMTEFLNWYTSYRSEEWTKIR